MDSIDGGTAARQELQLPARPPYALRGRVLSPAGDGGFVDLPDGVVEVAADGRIARLQITQL